MEDDNRRRAVAMGFLACASKWTSIWVAFALPASLLWAVLLAEHLYWLLFLPALLTVAGLSFVVLGLSRFRMMRRYYPEKIKTDSVLRRMTRGT